MEEIDMRFGIYSTKHRENIYLKYITKLQWKYKLSSEIRYDYSDSNEETTYHVYFIEVPDISNLVDIMKIVRHNIILTNEYIDSMGNKESYLCLEIYDAYRE